MAVDIELKKFGVLRMRPGPVVSKVAEICGAPAHVEGRTIRVETEKTPAEVQAELTRMELSQLLPGGIEIVVKKAA
ncbi:MAG: hypothetical protein K9L85_01000 [Candidatus Peribacteraceae bacterium]|nr:hypothetical protein [Candidatus Peribacteraceae bacterium]